MQYHHGYGAGFGVGSVVFVPATQFQVLPGIDLRGGRVVRLRPRSHGPETVFALRPRELAQRYADSGVEWLHVADLDGARSGRFENLAALEAIAHDGRLRVQAGGGVRTTDDLRRLYAAGVARVVVDDAALENPYATAIWIGQFGGERLVLTLAIHRQAGHWRVSVPGRADHASVRLEGLAAHYQRAGACHVLCASDDGDGTPMRVNVGLYRDLHALAPDFEIQAAGGACTLDDIRRLRDAGVRAVVVGRALLEGRFSLRDALRC